MLPIRWDLCEDTVDGIENQYDCAIPAACVIIRHECNPLVFVYKKFVDKPQALSLYHLKN